VDLGLSGKVAIVTGGAQGIGRAVTQGLASEGVDVVVGDIDMERLKITTKQISEGTGRKIVPVHTDTSKPEDVVGLVEAAIKEFGRVDILVNVAGRSPGGQILNLTEEEWYVSLNIKFMGYVRCMKAVIPHMIDQGGGCIINVVGNDGVKPSWWEVTAGAANAADLNLTASLSEQFGYNNIRINAINPGPVNTQRWAWLEKTFSKDKGIPGEEVRERTLKSIPLGRICEPEDVANLALFIASDRGGYLNGAVINLDGGQRKAIMDW
jgi:NAD(P)-dependent dehydrogenase (short-subunit alcohol dehydrogenase family)